MHITIIWSYPPCQLLHTSLHDHTIITTKTKNAYMEVFVLSKVQCIMEFHIQCTYSNSKKGYLCFYFPHQFTWKNISPMVGTKTCLSRKHVPVVSWIELGLKLFPLLKENLQCWPVLFHLDLPWCCFYSKQTLFSKPFNQHHGINVTCT